MWNIHGCRAGKGSLERVAKTTSQKHCRSHGSGAGNRPNKCRVITGERKLRDSCELCSWRWKCLNETLGGQRHYSERQTAWVRQATGRASADRSWWSRMTLVAFIRRPHTRRYTERMTNEDEDTLDVTLNDNVDARLNFHVVDCMVDKTYPHWIFFGDWMYVFGDSLCQPLHVCGYEHVNYARLVVACELCNHVIKQRSQGIHIQSNKRPRGLLVECPITYKQRITVECLEMNISSTLRHLTASLQCKSVTEHP